MDEHEGAALLGVSYWTTRELVNSGLLPSVAIPSPLNTRRRLRRRLIDRRDIEAFIAKYKTTERAVSTALTLRPYQRDAIAAVHAAVQRGLVRLLIALPTGCGKTLIFAELIRQILLRSGGQALVLAHRDELLGQAAAKIRQVYPDAQIGLVKGESDEVHAKTVVASVQTLARSSRLVRLPNNFAVVVVDEAHHSSAPSYQRILEHVGAFRPDGPLVIGVTATPERADGVALVGETETWLEIVHEAQLAMTPGA